MGAPTYANTACAPPQAPDRAQRHAAAHLASTSGFTLLMPSCGIPGQPLNRSVSCRPGPPAVERWQLPQQQLQAAAGKPPAARLADQSSAYPPDSGATRSAVRAEQPDAAAAWEGSVQQPGCLMLHGWQEAAAVTSAPPGWSLQTFQRSCWWISRTSCSRL